jgi:hypothetical protein
MGAREPPGKTSPNAVKFSITIQLQQHVGNRLYMLGKNVIKAMV